MPCPKNPTEFTLLKSVLNQHDVSREDKKIITEGITQIFKDEKKKKKNGWRFGFCRIKSKTYYM